MSKRRDSFRIKRWFFSRNGEVAGFAQPCVFYGAGGGEALRGVGGQKLGNEVFGIVAHAAPNIGLEGELTKPRFLEDFLVS